MGRLEKNALKIVMTDIFEALLFLKYANILHLDLKPENVFLVDNKSFNVVIGDFGLARYGNKIQRDFNVQTCGIAHQSNSSQSILIFCGFMERRLNFLELIIDYPLLRLKMIVDYIIF